MAKKKKSLDKGTKELKLKNQIVKIGLAVTGLQKIMQQEFQKFSQKMHENFAEVKSDIAGLKEMTSERPTRQELHHILNVVIASPTHLRCVGRGNLIDEIASSPRSSRGSSQ